MDERADELERDLGLLLAFVSGRDVPCPVCKYNLRDLRTERCPECGQVLTLRLTPAEPKFAPWLATLVPLLVASGVTVFLVIALIRDRSSAGFRFWWYGIFVYGAFAFPVLAAIAIAARRRFQRLSFATQVICGIIATALMVTLTLGLTGIIMRWW